MARLRYWNQDPTVGWDEVTGKYSGSALNTFEVFSLVSRTASANSSDFETNGRWDRATAYLTVTAVSGTLPTLDVIYQTSPDGGATWYDHEHFEHVVVADNQVMEIDNPGPFFRFRAVQTGTSDDFTFGVDIVGHRIGGRY